MREDGRIQLVGSLRLTHPTSLLLRQNKTPFTLRLSKGGWLRRSCFDKPVLSSSFILRGPQDERLAEGLSTNSVTVRDDAGTTGSSRFKRIIHGGSGMDLRRVKQRHRTILVADQ